VVGTVGTRVLTARASMEVKLDFLRDAALVLALVMVGMFAGVFGLYSNAIMPGLRRTDDRTFVGAFQAIDTAVINPLFLSTLFGGLVFTGLAVALHLGDEYMAALPWLITAFVLYLIVIIVTLAVNVPLNDAIKAAGDPDRITDLAAVRDQFSETRWLRWNHLRTVLTVGAFGCLTWAAVLIGRSMS
jgi:uncharacterized membrane protein